MTRRRVVVLAAALLAACAGRKADRPVKHYTLTGDIVRLEPERKTAVIRHEAIAGWMEAMTMEFPVRDRVEFGKLSTGQRIRATVNVQDLEYWLTDIRPVESKPSANP